MPAKPNAKAQTRTGDTRIFSAMLYQLSYLGPMPEVEKILTKGGQIVKRALVRIRVGEPY